MIEEHSKPCHGFQEPEEFIKQKTVSSLKYGYLSIFSVTENLKLLADVCCG